MSTIAIYFILAFGYTWAFHWRIARANLRVDEGQGQRLYWLGLPGPTLAAMALSLASGSLHDLLHRVSPQPIAVQWWLLALLPVPASYLLANVIHAFRSGARPARLFHAVTNASYFTIDLPPEAEPLSEAILLAMALLCIFLLPHP
jgi:hypothetical protein